MVDVVLSKMEFCLLSRDEQMTQLLDMLPDHLPEADMVLVLEKMRRFESSFEMGDFPSLSCRTALARKLRASCVGAATPYGLRLVSAAAKFVCDGGCHSSFYKGLCELSDPTVICAGVRIQDLVAALCDLADEPTAVDAARVLAKFHKDPTSYADREVQACFQRVQQSLRKPSREWLHMSQLESTTVAETQEVLEALSDLVSAFVVDDIVRACDVELKRLHKTNMRAADFLMCASFVQAYRERQAVLARRWTPIRSTWCASVIIAGRAKSETRSPASKRLKCTGV